MSRFTWRRPDPHRGEDEEPTVRIARKRFARRQWTRRWLAWRRVALAAVLGGLVAAGVWLVLFSAVLSVSGVRIEGTAVLDPRDVRRAADVPTGGALATADLDAIAARVEELAAVKDVDVSRSWPDRVRIAVVERQAVAVVERDGVLHGLDADGVMFRSYPSRPRGLPVIRIGPATRADALAEAAKVAGALPASLTGRVDYVEVRTVDTLSLTLENGRTVRWGSADDSVAKAKVLAVLLTQKARSYDVSVPGQPIIRQ